MKNIFVTRPIPEVGLKELRDQGYSVDVNQEEKVPSQKELITKLKKKPYDAVITLLTDKVDGSFLDAVPTATIISNYAVGFDNVNLAEAKKRNVMVANTAGMYSHCVAEHTFALMLALSTRLVEADAFIRKGKYKGWSPSLFMGIDLKGKTLGLIGAGRIGEQVAYRAHGFEMNVIYHDIVHNERLEQEDKAKFRDTIEEVLKEADFISLHVPLLESTHHLMNEERFKMMKPTAYLINTSRGPVVDEYALLKALQTGVIKGAGLDVYEFEPNPVPGLTKLTNVVLTPHIASARDSARNQMSMLAAQNIIDAFHGRTPKGMVK